VAIVGIIAGESSFVVGLRQLSDTRSLIRHLTIDLTGCIFSITEPLILLVASRSTGETISFSRLDRPGRAVTAL